MGGGVTITPPRVQPYNPEPFDPLDQQRKMASLQAMQQGVQQQKQMAPLQLQQAQQSVEQGALQTKMMRQQMKDQENIQEYLQNNPGKTFGDAAKSLQGKVSFAGYAQLMSLHAQTAKAAKEDYDNMKAQHDAYQGIYDSARHLSDQEFAAQWPQIAQAVASVPGNQIPADPQQPMTKEQFTKLSQFLPLSEAYLKREAAEREQLAKTQEAESKAQIAQQEAGLSPEQRGLKGNLAYQAASGSPTAAAAMKMETQQKIASRPVNQNNIMTRDDAKEIADAIENGDQPPTLQGLYRNAGPVRAELARRGVPIARMEMDWKATQRFISSMNGPQQLRLRQSIESASGLLPKIESLYAEWEKLAPVSGFKIANHAALIAMKNLPGRPGAVAQALDTQISELTADLGNVYMGGNSPTDQSLKLAAKALASEWGPDAFEEGIKQAKLNVGIRKNSIQHSMPQGVSPDSTYYQGGQDQAPAAQQTQPMSATGPNGHKIVVKDGKWVDAQTGAPVQ